MNLWPHKIKKVSNFIFSQRVKCVWLIIVGKGTKVKINFQAFDTLLQNKHCVWYVKVKIHVDLHASYNCDPLSTLQLISTGKKVQISFITGPNKIRSIGFLLKHLPYGKSKVPIISNESIKTVTLNKKGMQIYYVVVVYTIQNVLLKNLTKCLHLRRFLMKIFNLNYWSGHIC